MLFFICFHIIFLIFQFSRSLFYGLNSTKERVNSEVEIFFRSDDNDDLWLDLNQVLYTKIYIGSFLTLGQVQPLKTSLTTDHYPNDFFSGQFFVAYYFFSSAFLASTAQFLRS